jgi:hypothetical protein
MSDKYKMTVIVRQPDGPPIGLLTSRAQGMHPAFGVSYVRSLGLDAEKRYNAWYEMKLQEEKELANGE